MRKLLIALIFVVIAVVTLRSSFRTDVRMSPPQSEQIVPEKTELFREIAGKIKRGETLFDIFKRYGINFTELFNLKEASADVHELKKLYPGRPYKILLDYNDRVNLFEYRINDDTVLSVSRTESGFYAKKVLINYDRKLIYRMGVIEDSVIESIGGGKDNLLLALSLSDVFAWDIDFTTDLRKGDKYKIIVEGLYLDGQFKKYGNILSALFINNGKIYRAYRYEYDGEADYFDPEGKSLRKAFLKAPLNFRRISSFYSKRRFHPILKKYRPHRGIDYTAPSGTPVSAVGDGTVIYSGYKGEFGKLVKIRHPNGYKTYYGHLSKIRKNARKGMKVKQGDIIGYVGTTGLTTGPHLHYEMRVGNRPVNPRKVKVPRGKPVPSELKVQFIVIRDKMDDRLASIKFPLFALNNEDQNYRARGL
jgi:murein DD-endopeptidase MepM/ murein hydrolase activator NlpD